jgi:hypothetical protein
MGIAIWWHPSAIPRSDWIAPRPWPGISTNTELARDAVPVGKHPMEMAGSSQAPSCCGWQHVTYAAADPADGRRPDATAPHAPGLAVLRSAVPVPPPWPVAASVGGKLVAAAGKLAVGPPPARAAPGEGGLGASASRPQCGLERLGPMRGSGRSWVQRCPDGPRLLDCSPVRASQAHQVLSNAARLPHRCRRVASSLDFRPERARCARSRAYSRVTGSKNYCLARARRVANQAPGADRSPRLACQDVRALLDRLPGRARCARNPVSGSARSPHQASSHVPSQPHCCPECARRAVNLAPGAGRSKGPGRRRVPRRLGQYPACAKQAPGRPTRGLCRLCRGLECRRLWRYSPQPPPARALRRRRRTGRAHGSPPRVGRRGSVPRGAPDWRGPR